MTSRSFVKFAIFLAVFLTTAVPYAQFIIQRNALDSDIGRIMLDYGTAGEEGFRKRLDQVCEKALLEPGSYDVTIDEDSYTSEVVVTLSYTARFKILFMEHSQEVELVNETRNFGL